MILKSTALSDVGTYLFKVTLNDGLDSASQTLELDVTNSPPYFIDKKPSDLVVKFNNSFSYKLPEFKDDEGNPIYVIIQPNSVSDFIKEDKGFLIIYPTNWK